MMIVDEYQDKDDRQEKRVHERRRRETPLGGARIESESGQQLDERILERDRLPAESALATQPKKREDRDVVVRPHGLAAARAV
jgi:hypothetical protein